MKSTIFLFVATIFVCHNFLLNSDKETHLFLLSKVHTIASPDVVTALESGDWAITQQTAVRLSKKLEADLIITLENGQVVGASRKSILEDGALLAGTGVFYSKLFSGEVNSFSERLSSDPPARLSVVQSSSKYRESETGALINQLIPFFLGALLLNLFFTYRRKNRLIKQTESILGEFSETSITDTVEAAQNAFDKKFAKAQEEIKQKTSILSSMDEGVLAVDKEGKVLILNPKGASLLGVAKLDVIGKLMESTVPSFELQTLIREVMDSGSAVKKDISVSEHIINVRIDSIVETSGVLAVFSDVTKIRQLDKVRKEFIANVSHELKTPVTAIKGFCETLLDGDTGNYKKYLGIIFGHSQRLQAIIEDLLKLASIEGSESVKLTLQPLEPIFDEVVGLLIERAQTQDIELVKKLEENFQVNVDSSLLKQALYNLTENALKYTENGGKIVLSARVSDKELLIHVADNGAGIPEEHLPRLFERFYVVDKARTRETGGTGLGLSIVKHISLALKGYVTVRSKLRKGSVFTIHLPLTPQ